MAVFLLFVLPLILLYVCFKYRSSKKSDAHGSSFVSVFGTHNLPKPYSLMGLILTPDEARLNYVTHMLAASSSSTVAVHLPLGIGGGGYVFTATPDNTRHILKTRSSNYLKGTTVSSTYTEIFGRGMFGLDGDEWRSQRHFLFPNFTKGSVRAAMETVVDPCISTCLLPAMTVASHNAQVVDLQHILQWFSFDTSCKMAFGATGGDRNFFQAYNQAISVCYNRSKLGFPSSIQWRIEKLLNIGSQRRLMGFIHTIRASALSMIHKKRDNGNDDEDFLARALQHYNNDDNMVIDLMINFLLGGYETIASALTWFFWVVSTNPEVEAEILKEIRRVKEAKDMVYTHAALCESMRLYPPVPGDCKMAAEDDVLPDGTRVKKGMKVIYSMYSMGRSERIWGPDWSEYNPKRWLRTDDVSATWTFVPRDPYTYPVFNAGPRICIGMDLAFLQMKTIIARVLLNFKMLPCMNTEPVYVFELTSKMKGGLLVRLEQRNSIKH